MAIFRKIHVTFWSDVFIESLTPDQKYFYLYLLTNDKTKQCGIYQISYRQICFDTGYNNDTVEKLMSFFIKKGKVKFDKANSEIALKNWSKYNDSASPKVKSCINKELESVKSKDLIEYLYSSDTHTQQEEEPEQEPEGEQKAAPVKKISIEERAEQFRTEVYTFVKYNSDVLIGFYNYWSELNPAKTKMRWEMQSTWETSKRLSTWLKNNNKQAPNMPAKGSVYL